MVLALALGLCPGAGAWAAAPARVVSMNLCTDELAMMLAAPGQLISISFLAADPMVSAMVKEARAYPKNHGQAEEIFLLHPDLVLAGPYSSRATVALLRRLGVTVAVIPAPQSLAGVPGAIRAAGRAMGREAAAGAMAARFSRRLAALKAKARAGRAALYGPSGFTSGPGTLADDILKAAGFGNVAAEVGISGYARLPLEELVMAWPDLVVTARHYPGASRPEAILHHPALKALEARIGPPVRSGPGWDCATPKLLDAIAALEARR
jgi:iron complex transport system substrate-binding protein